MAVDPVTNRLLVLDNNFAPQGNIYSVKTSPFDIPVVVSSSVPDSARSIAFNGTCYSLVSTLGPYIYKFVSGSLLQWNNGTTLATTGATATNVAFEEAYGLAFDAAGNLLISDASQCHVWLVEA
jgi:hypothetical protein